jgi:Spy/CpxP family protein refolding chaperone
VKGLNLSDSTQGKRVRDVIVQQYRDLNTVHEAHKAAVKAIRDRKDADKTKADGEIKELEKTREEKLAALHPQYLAKLSALLTPAQVEQVKDGMTYGVLPITYKGYLDMLPSLTDEQKKQIKDYLTEAREHAMDAGSSEEKHGWFGKYKGRINNYLSKAGYDMKKAGDDWEKRRKAAEGKSK